MTRCCFSLCIMLLTMIAAPAHGQIRNPQNGHYYDLVDAGFDITWSSARDQAASLHHLGIQGHLVTITSLIENDFVMEEFPEVLSGEYWLGGYQPDGIAEPTVGWRWVTDEPWEWIPMVPPWAPNQPNDNSGNNPENALHYHPNQIGLWNDIPFEGAVNPNFRPSGFVVEFSPIESGDYDVDGDVDGNDFLVWQRELSAPPGSPADGNGDSQVNELDLTIWRNHFGSAASFAIPEGSSLTIILIALAALAVRRKSRGGEAVDAAPADNVPGGEEKGDILD